MLNHREQARFRIMHVPYGYMPDAIGGTETYVRDLAQELKSTGLCSSIAAPGTRSDVYEMDGFTVHRFAVGSELSLRELYGDGDECAAGGFEKILDDVRPDLLHLHAFSPAVSIRLVRDVRARGLPIVFTYHTPTVSCQRGTLLRWGHVDCDGVMDTARCARCAMHGAGLDRLTAHLIGALPVRLCKRVDTHGLEGRAWTALRAPALIDRQHAAVRELITTVDHIVAPSVWVRDLLLANGASTQNISLVRQGSKTNVTPLQHEEMNCQYRPGERLRLVFLGRIDPTKGVDVILSALRSVPEVDVTFDVFGIIQGDAGADYAKSLRDLAGHDRRVRFLPPIASGSVVPTLANYDLLVIPSRFKETGPLVLLDAFAAGIPVAGSDFGGIAERIRNGVDGILIEPNDARAWADAIGRLAQKPDILSRLRANVRPPRTMRDVAADMREIYEDVLRTTISPSASTAAARREAYPS